MAQSTINTIEVGAQIYAIVVSSKNGVILHLGVHYSLDEAYSAARDQLYAYTPHKPNMSVDIDFWATMSPVSIARALVKGSIEDFALPTPIEKEKSLSDQIKDAKQQKNAIMKSILLKKDLGLLREAKPLLSRTEVKFIENKLTVNK